jgi:hypothetical protein
MKTVFFCVVTAVTMVAVTTSSDKLDIADPVPQSAVVNTMDLLGRSCGKLKLRGQAYGSATIGFYRGRLVVVTAGHCFNDEDEKAELVLDRPGGRVTITVKCTNINRGDDLAIAVPVGYVPPFKYPDLTVADPVAGEVYTQWSYDVGYEQLLTIGRIQRPNTPYPDFGDWNIVSVVDGNSGPGASGAGIWVKRGFSWKLAGIYVGRLAGEGWAFRNAVGSKLLREFMDGAH